MKIKIYKSVKRKTAVIFENNGQYGRDFLECQIVLERGTFRAYLTDGYRFLNAGQCCDSLKEAIAFGQAEIKQAALKEAV